MFPVRGDAPIYQSQTSPPSPRRRKWWPARIIMLISALTMVLVIAAVITVIGYRMFGGSGPVVATDEVIPLPKGARLISTSASAGRVAVLIELDRVNELRTFDIKKLKQTGRLRFPREP